MAGDAAKTVCHVDEKARDIEHAKRVSQQVSKVRLLATVWKKLWTLLAQFAVSFLAWDSITRFVGDKMKESN